MRKFELGNYSESIVLSAYLEAGFTVSIPFGSGASYDLLVDNGISIFKIQVKTAWVSNGVLKYKCLRRQPKSETRRVYKKEEVDYLAIFCPYNNSLFGISIENHPTGGWLRLEPVKNGQSKNIRWALDYTWEKHIKELKEKRARQESNLRPFGPEPNALSTELRARNENYRTNKFDSQQI
jgi:PD-(D/E)XK endonuclease